MRIDKIILFLIFCFILNSIGCAWKKENSEITENLQTQPALNALYQSIPPSEGSLWSETGDMLFMDKKAKKVGDTIIVDIDEDTSSSMDANTDTSSTSTVDLDISNLLGYMRAAEALRRNLHKDENDKYVNKLIGAESENTFNGSGKSGRSGTIKASIGSTVTEILPNGNLHIYGKKEMKLNNELQFITISGVVRPEDISADNRVKSEYIADAQIEYSGRGVLSDKQKPGWGARILDKVWPF